MPNWIDVSVPLKTSLVHWPGDPEPTFELISDIEHGAEANVTLCRMTAHTGTHMDAPRHFLADSEVGIDQFPLELGIGKARVIEIPRDREEVGRAELEMHNLQRGERILLKTRNSSSQWQNADFNTNFAAVNASGAQYLVESGVGLIGIDYLSIGRFHGDIVETHRILLNGSVWILEGLLLQDIQPGVYDMICLPLKIAGADGAPARVVLSRSEP